MKLPMNITHVHFPEGTEEFDKHLFINRMASLFSSIAEVCSKTHEAGDDKISLDLLGSLIQTLLGGDEEIEKALNKCTTDGLAGDFKDFHVVGGKENLPDNVMSFKDHKSKRTVH